MASRRRLEQRFPFASRADHHHRLRRPVLEVLEGRALLSTFTVNSLGDVGSGSNGSGDLRYCINQANADDQANTIVFDPTVFSTPQTITLGGSQLGLSDTGGTQTITGPAAGVTVSAGGMSRVLEVDSGVTASLSGLTISGGSTPGGNGGGLANYGTAALTDCTISGNITFSETTVKYYGYYGFYYSHRYYGNGGGAFNSSAANLTLTACTISGNYAGLDGGSLDNSGTANLTNCTLSGNAARYGGGMDNSGTANLTNCTLSGNSARYSGGLNNSGTANLTDCTVSGNSVGGSFFRVVVGGIDDAGGTTTLSNTIVAGNSSGDIEGPVSGSYNLIGTGGSGGLVNGVNGNLVGVYNPGLGTLGNYGGPTETIPLLPGSPAIDAGSNALVPAGVTTDQRGLARIVTGFVDIGAFESQGFTLTAAAGSTPQTANNGNSFTNPLEVTVTANNPVEPVDGGVVTFAANPAANGASALLSTSSVVIANGQASSLGAPNDVDGSYTVTASAADSSSVISFALTNTGPVLTNLVVNTTSSSLFPGGGLLSLPLGIALANAETAGSAQISFDSSVFSTPQTITLSGSQLELKNTGVTQTISGPAARVTISGGGINRVFLVDSGVTASLSGLTISGGSVIGNGGGLANYGTATLTDCTLSGNSASSSVGSSGFGGGVFNSGTAYLTDCTVSDNSSGSGGGGLDNSGTTNLTLTGCTVSGNITSFYGGGGLDNSGTANLTDCTLSGSYARYGGGVQNSGTANLTGCTISGNYAYSGGGIDNAGGTTTLANTIVAGNSYGDIEGQVSGSYNLIGTGGSGGLVNGQDGNLVGVAGPLLAPLSNYGGPTQTVALLPGSPAIGAGISVSGVTTDQRGEPLDTPDPDIGAFQSQGFTLTPIAGSTPQSSAIGAAFMYPLAVTVTANNPVEPVDGGVLTFVAPSVTSGASAFLSASSVVIAGGEAAVSAGPNNADGSYQVTASASDASPVFFNLTNTGPVFASLSVNTAYGALFPGAGLLSLPEAVLFANLDHSGNANITFDPNVFHTPQTITLTGTELELSNTAETETITGPAAGVTVSGNGMSRVFEVDSGVTASISGLTISGGTVSPGDNGGGLANYGTATLTGCTLSGNSATASAAYHSTGGLGGGVFNSRTANLTLTNCTVSGNSSGAGGHNEGGGGGLANYGTTTLTGCTVSDNYAPSYNGYYNGINGFGGGVFNSGTANLTMTGCTISGNYAGGGGGGVFNSGYANLTMTECALSGNYADGSGGGLDNAGAATLTNCTLSANYASVRGGGLFNGGIVTLTSSTVSGNTGSIGGGLDNDGAAYLTDCALSGNLSRYGGGVLNYQGAANLTACTLSGNYAGVGGGVANVGGTANLTACTISGNSAYFGGGLENSNLDGILATTNLTDCTVSGNSATGSGGGVCNGSGTANLTACTVSGNYAGAGGGGLENVSYYYGEIISGTANLSDTIVAGNTNPSGASDIGGPSNVSGNNNLIGTGGSGGLVDGDDGNIVLTSLTDLGLAPLSNNGGPTQTMALLAGSLAIGAGVIADYPGTNTPITTDQRDDPLDTPNPDIGAYQTQGSTLIALAFSGISDQSITYGTASVIVSGSLNSDSQAPLGESVLVTLDGVQQWATIGSGGTFSTTFNNNDLAVAVSPYTINYAYTSDGTFASASTTSTLTVTTAMLTVTASPESKVYGTADPALAYTVTGFQFSDTASTVLNGSLARANAGTLAGEQTGSYAIAQGTLAANSNYTITFARSTLTITPATLTVTANSQTKVYGTNDPSLTESATGLVNTTVDGVTIDDTAASAVSGSVVRAQAGTLAGEQVGDYTITQGALNADSNYTISFTNGTLAITPATVTVTASSQTKVFGTSDPSLTDGVTGLVDVTVDGVTIDDPAGSVLTGILARAQLGTLAGEQIGSYAITQGTLASDSDYALHFTGNLLTIIPAPLAVTANPETKVYGTADPSLAVTATGLVDVTVDGVTIDDTAASVLTGSLARAQFGTLAGEQVGSRAITQGTLVADSNYTLHFTGNSLTITPAPLTVTTNPQTKVYGTEDPTLTDTATGFVSTTVDGVTIADTAASVLTGNVARAQSATLAGEQAGPYAITQGTLAASNYTINFTASTLTITPAILTVTANAQIKVYGTSDPSLTDGVTGLVDLTVDTVRIDDTAASVLSGSLARAQAGTLAGEQAGSFAITQGTLAADSDYSLHFTGNTLMINPAPVTVAANPKTKVYGTVDPTLTETATGLVSTMVDGVTIDDTAASALTGHLSRTPGETVAGGPYAITQGTLSASNYTINFTASTLTITPATLTVTANSQTKVYGTTDPSLTDGVTGLVDTTVDGVTIDDTAASVLSGNLTRAQSATLAGEQAGSYAITQGTLAADSNYALHFTDNTLTITPATLTVTANSETKVYGTTDPGLTDTATGLVNTTVDGVTIDDSVALALTGSLSRTPGETVAGCPYAITQGTLAASNYSIAFTGNALTITPATLTIMAEPESKVFGSADPALAFTASGFQFSDSAARVLTGSPLRTAGETVSGSPYTIGQGTLAANSNYTIHFTGGTLAITPATPTLSVSDPGGTYTGSPIAASATVTGVSGTTAGSLEGITPTLAYYAGSGTSGTDLGATAPSAGGTYTVVASFPGSADYAAAHSAPRTFVISSPAATIALTSSTGAADYGEAVTFVATVSSPSGTPSGTVTFFDGASPLGTVALNSSGQAALSVNGLALGANAITATYNGGAGSLTTSSSTITESVSQAATAIVLMPQPVVKGKKRLKTIELTAQIEPAVPGGEVRTGQVIFELIKRHGTKTHVTKLGTAAVSGGAATLTVKSSAVLNQTLVVVYSGDPDFLASDMAPSKLTKAALASSRI